MSPNFAESISGWTCVRDCHKTGMKVSNVVWYFPMNEASCVEPQQDD